MATICPSGYVFAGQTYALDIFALNLQVYPFPVPHYYPYVYEQPGTQRLYL